MRAFNWKKNRAAFVAVFIMALLAAFSAPSLSPCLPVEALERDAAFLRVDDGCGAPIGTISESEDSKPSVAEKSFRGRAPLMAEKISAVSCGDAAAHISLNMPRPLPAFQPARTRLCGIAEPKIVQKRE